MYPIPACNSLMKKVELKTETIKEKTSSISDRDPQGDRLKQALEFEKKMRKNRFKVEREITFYEDNDNCPIYLLLILEQKIP